jgi:hypothetical protein
MMNFKKIGLVVALGCLGVLFIVGWVIFDPVDRILYPGSLAGAGAGSVATNIAVQYLYQQADEQYATNQKATYVETDGSRFLVVPIQWMRDEPHPHWHIIYTEERRRAGITLVIVKTTLEGSRCGGRNPGYYELGFKIAEGQILEILTFNKG